MNDASQEAQLRWEVLLNVMLALLTEVFHALLEIGVWEREEFDTFLDGAFQDDLRQFIESEQRVDVHRGLSMNAIAKQLTSERVPTQRDRRARGPARKLGAGTWHPSSLFALLTNRTYTGVQYYGKTENATSPTNPDKKTRHRMKQTEDWLAIAVPPLIDQDTFEAAQTRMQHNARMSRRNRKHEYLLCNARLRCGQCGSSMSGQRNTTNALRYYRCSGAPYHNATRCRKVANARAIETEVWSAVEAALQDPEIIAREVHRRLEHADREQDTVTRERECFTRQLGQCEKELQKWEAAYVAEVITLDDFRTKKADVAGRRASLEREIARLEAEQQLLRQVELETTSLIEYCQRVRGNLCQFSTAEQHVALDVLNIAVIWHPEKPLEIRGSIPIGIASNTP
jgi:site-specific DNA recombinase